MKRKIDISVITISILLILSSTYTVFFFGNEILEIIKKRNNNHHNHEFIYDNISIDVFFSKNDNCSKIIHDFILRKNVTCAFYDLDLKNLIDVLKKNEIKIVMDDKYSEELKNHKMNIKNDNSKKYMHNKFCVNEDAVITGSINPTLNGVVKNDNNLILIKSDKLSENYIDEFTEMYEKGEFHLSSSNKVKNKIIKDKVKNITIKNLFCPEDDCENNIVKELLKAKQNIYFMTFSFTSQRIGNLLISKIWDGITVKGVFENMHNKNSKYSEYRKLKKIRPSYFKLDKNPNNMHHKVFIIDNKTIITGSYNPTNNGNKNNDENILIIDHKITAKKYLREFKRIWDYNE